MTKKRGKGEGRCVAALPEGCTWRLPARRTMYHRKELLQGPRFWYDTALLVPAASMRGKEVERSQEERNAEAYRQGMRDTATGTNFGRPSRRYPTAEEQASYEMGFYKELEAMEEEFLDGTPEEG